MKLLESQKHEIYEMIERAGMSPSDFEFTETKSIYKVMEVVTVLERKRTNYWFKFESKSIF